MFQALFEEAVQPKFSPAAMRPVVIEMQQMGFQPVALCEDVAVFRDGDRYVEFKLTDDVLSIRLGVGSHDTSESIINSMRLDELIAFMYGGMKRGCQLIGEQNLERCLTAAMKDVKEFANEFLRGDFRPFLRVLALKKREDRAAAAASASKDLSNSIYVA